MNCGVTETGAQTVVQQVKQPFSLKATPNKAPVAGSNTAVIEVTLYQETGSFIPQCTYLFEAVDSHGQPLEFVDAEEFKQAINTYCTGVLATTYYLKSIPRASSLCSAEMQAFNF